MNLELEICTAFLLDLLIGDPRFFPHPVRLMGKLALAAEPPLRKIIGNQKIAGVFAVLLIVGSSSAAAWLAIAAASSFHPWAGSAVSVYLLYSCFATKDLASHASKVHRALQVDNLKGARKAVSQMVGRDTTHLEEKEIVRASIESVSENLVDGITAPLFFAVLGGPVAAIAYKAINTLDSTFGYKNERFLLFGWASARLDDAANYLPARLTAPLIAVASLCLRLDAAGAIQAIFRDAKNHPSPNSGISEAAFAGAMRIQLGGINYYEGIPSVRPLMGRPMTLLSPRNILTANNLMLLTALFCLLGFLALRIVIFSA